MPSTLELKIRELKVRAVCVPMAAHRTASGVVSESPLVLTDAVTEDGIVGHSVVFTYTKTALKPTAELIQNLAALIKGERRRRSKSNRGSPSVSGCSVPRAWWAWP